MIYTYQIKYKDYDAIANEHITKVVFGDAEVFAESNRLIQILEESKAHVYKTDYNSKYNKYVVYDYKPPTIEGFTLAYSLSFKDKSYIDYFYYLLDKYYEDLNYYETIYELEPCIKAGDSDDR